MQDAVMPAFAAWESFYVIVGSAGGALTGLQFVVMALISESGRQPSSETLGAFATPTIVHFCVVLFVAAVLNTPWRTLVGPTITLGACGAAGIAYIGIVTARAHRQSDYVPDREDWFWYTALPFLAYAMVLAGGVALPRFTSQGLFLLGATCLLLLFIGIHNAWDTVTYVAVQNMRKKT